MEGEASQRQQQPDPKAFPRWVRVLCVVWGIALAVALLALIVKAGRRAGPALAVAAGSAVAGTMIGRIPKRMQSPIDKGFVRSTVQGLAQHLLKTEGEAVFTPTELFRFLNIMLEKAELTLFSSPQEMARLLDTMGLKSQVRTVANRSERRWYDLADYGTHETPIR